MSDDDDELMFEDDGAAEPARPGPSAVRWKMLVVDDEPEVHSITRLVLADFSFKGRSAQFLSAYSAAEAIEILEREKDVAVILLDVVMETDDAGLKLVHHIREVMNNELRVCAARSRRGSSVERTRGCWHPHRAHKSLWKFHLMAAAKACWRSVASRRWNVGGGVNP